MSDRQLKYKILIADLTPIIKNLQRYKTLLSILNKIPLDEIIEALLAVSSNHQPSPVVSGRPSYMDVLRDDNELIWYVIENGMGELFETLPINDLDSELQHLLFDLDGLITPILPEGWGPGEYTFHSWVGPGHIAILKDH